MRNFFINLHELDSFVGKWTVLSNSLSLSYSYSVVLSIFMPTVQYYNIGKWAAEQHHFYFQS